MKRVKTWNILTSIRATPIRKWPSHNSKIYVLAAHNSTYTLFKGIVRKGLGDETTIAIATKLKFSNGYSYPMIVIPKKDVYFWIDAKSDETSLEHCMPKIFYNHLLRHIGCD